MALSAASLVDATAVGGYLRRLDGLPEFFDALGRRYLQAATEGRRPTAVGVAQAVEQLHGHLAAPAEQDVFHRPTLPPDVDLPRVHARISATVAELETIDGTSGAVYLGAVPVRPSPVVEYFEGRLAPQEGDDGQVPQRPAGEGQVRR